MEHEALLRRLQDLAERCDRTGLMTQTGFLTPAEQAAAAAFAAKRRCGYTLDGGQPDCERKVLFFQPESVRDTASALCAVQFSCAFGAPEHRDYMGAILAGGIRREWVGDIQVYNNGAYVFCLPTVAEQLAAMERIGRFDVRAKKVSLCDVPAPEIRRKSVSFSVQSLRLDAILSDLFHLPRTAAAKLIVAGAASVNYVSCMKPDAPIKPGDILSLRGYGKGKIVELGGVSRKGRQFVQAQIYE